MAATGTQSRAPQGVLDSLTNGENTLGTLLRYLGLMVLDAMALIMVYGFLGDNNLALAIVFGVITLGANIIILVPGLYPLRWMTPGLMLVSLFIIYPMIYTVLTSVTNYGDGHLLTKENAIELIERRTYVPEDAPQYSWTLYQNEAGEYGLWLSRELEDGGLEVAFAPLNGAIEEIENPPVDPPGTYEDYRLLDRGESARALTTVQDAVFGEGEDTAAIANRRVAARPLEQQYTYNAEIDAIIDNQTETVYYADGEEGFFVSEGGEQLAPGYRVNVGLDNFTQLWEDRTLLEPLIDVFVWTVVFALLSVLTTFVVGLGMAIIFNSPDIPFRKFWRSLIFIPYAIPGVISIVVWRGMLNQNLGIITNTWADLFGYRIPWFADPIWAKVAIVLVNLWLGYPYMMLICSGALQAIPSDVYEAASVDGATPYQSFWRITLPLLLITVGPLLIASFTFNFNNYLLIEALTSGNPPIPGTSTPAGYTDILISYTYNLAFGSNTGADYGYASAITIVIFVIVGTITFFNFRLTRQWEEVGENV